jgi:hypothetical protein
MTVGDYFVNYSGQGGGFVSTAGGWPVLTIGSNSTTEVTGAVRAINVDNNTTTIVTTLRESPAAGLVQRYLLFKSYTNGDTAGLNYDSVTGTLTSLNAMVQC